MKQYSGITYNADIYVAGDIKVIEEVCRAYCYTGFCVNIQPVTFIYTGGQETGAKVGLINYQRFPDHADAIKEKALQLAELLIEHCYQTSASVVTSDETIYLTKREDK